MMKRTNLIVNLALVAVIGTITLGTIEALPSTGPTVAQASWKTMRQKQKAKKLELGASKKQVIKKLGKPERDDNQMLTYHDFVLYFENDKLVGSDLPEIQKKVDKKTAVENARKKQLKGQAQYFGRRPVYDLQKMPSAYKAVRSGDEMWYLYNPGEGQPLLLRVDEPGDMTTVYVYNKKKENGRGRLLYTGRTIYQKNGNNNQNYY